MVDGRCSRHCDLSPIGLLEQLLPLDLLKGSVALILLIPLLQVFYRWWDKSSELHIERKSRLGSIVFIGDSVTRYQYLSFVHWLASGEYPPRVGNYSWAEEKQWNGWTHFYNGTNSQLNSFRNGTEICDCYRNEQTGLHEIMENRKYSGILDVYYFQFFRLSIPLKGHLNFSGTCNISCVPGMCADKPTWELPLIGAFENIIAPLTPDVVILNSGLHESTNSWNDTMLNSILHQMESFRMPIWKTTTHRRGEISRPSTDYKILSNIAVRNRNITVFDAYKFTEKMPYNKTWDSVHFFSQTYEALNRELVNLLQSHGISIPIS